MFLRRMVNTLVLMQLIATLFELPCHCPNVCWLLFFSSIFATIISKLDFLFPHYYFVLY
ncbi:hypothetical protein Lalb_Chr25g0285741 [Lupinus albus]|uniref:Uncharacterized protein n=1 Tax=Lupinus albus TaxID=3870 RepID=A0A6A4N539_LUPAL|nr:hypothetical protein Lalb_Chr25g0285741 [Lupinus albus]